MKKILIALLFVLPLISSCENKRPKKHQFCECCGKPLDEISEGDLSNYQN